MGVHFFFQTEFVRDNQFGGVMVYSINTDDFMGTCQIDELVPKVKFPLIRRIAEVLNSNYSIL